VSRCSSRRPAGRPGLPAARHPGRAPHPFALLRSAMLRYAPSEVNSDIMIGFTSLNLAADFLVVPPVAVAVAVDRLGLGLGLGQIRAVRRCSAPGAAAPRSSWKRRQRQAGSREGPRAPTEGGSPVSFFWGSLVSFFWGSLVSFLLVRKQQSRTKGPLGGLSSSHPRLGTNLREVTK